MLPLNTTLQGRYQIVAQIGRGGMGAVYKAIDTRLRNTVALKQTLVEGEIARRAFEREAQLLASMRHRALPKVIDHFTDELGQFLVMEFIQGEDLATLLLQRGEPFSVADVLTWGDNLLDALEYLHSHVPPIVHRDIKPQNMKLTERGEIILLDFGLAKGATSAQATRAATTGSIFGYTPHFAPLEQIQGTGTGPRSDLYALAATLHNLLTGSPPPDALTRAAARINEEPDPLPLANELNPEVPAAVAAVLVLAMSQKPDQRPENAVAMRKMLREAGQGIMPSTRRLGDASTTSPINTPTSATVSATGATLATTGATISATGATLVATGTPVGAAARTATGDLPTAAGQIASGTTLTQAPTPIPTPPIAPARPGWIIPAIIGAVLVIGAAIVFGTGMFGRATTTDRPTPDVVAQQPSPNAPAAAAAAPTVDVQQLVVAAQTATFVAQAAQTQSVATLIAGVDSTRTSVAQATIDAAGSTEKTALAQTAAVVALTPTATIAPPTKPAEPTATAKPTATRDPNAATATTKPTATPKAAAVPTPPPVEAGKAAILAQGGGQEFKATASIGTIDAGQGDGGSCIQGSVKDSDGSLFSEFLVGIDTGGKLTKVSYNYRTGFFGACGLSAGDWGVVVYSAEGVDTEPADQGLHQVRIRLTGTPGEVAYVNFRAVNFDAPNPTATPLAGAYDGQWNGTISGKTAGNQDFTGRFRMEIRANAIYRISIDGPSCLFETYPNAPISDSNAFSTSGSPQNPAKGTDPTIQYTIVGSFASPSRASGQVNANQNGGMCIVANWSASR